MKKYVGNCSDAFDWDQITQKLDEQQVSHKKYEEGSTASKEIDDAWAESKESVDFFTYHTGEAYDPDLDKRFGEWIGCEPYMAWFSKMATGKSCGQHEDKEIAERLESEGKNMKDFVRYHVHVTEPCMGGVLIIEKDCYHMEEQGSVWEWNSPDALHLGVNAGHKTKVLYHFVGKKK